MRMSPFHWAGPKGAAFWAISGPNEYLSWGKYLEMVWSLGGTCGYLMLIPSDSEGNYISRPRQT